jgi:hypothetical protein
MGINYSQPVNVQQWSNPSNSFADNFGAVLGGILGERKKKAEMKEQEVGKILPALIQMGMLKPGKPGVYPSMPFAGINWQPIAKAPDVNDTHTDLESKKLRYELGIETPTDEYIKNQAIDLVTKMKYSNPYEFNLIAKKYPGGEEAYINDEVKRVFKMKKAELASYNISSPKSNKVVNPKSMKYQARGGGKTFYSDDNFTWYDESGNYVGSK